MLDAVDFQLVNPWQRGFPLVSRPFEALARGAGIAEAEAIARLSRLREQGVLDRIGPVFRPNTVGASLLAAMAVPAERLAAVAEIVGSHPGVNHNYERSHAFNLWFVITGTSSDGIEAALRDIERATGLAVLRLPLLEEYHIDLGFDLQTGHAPRGPAARVQAAPSGDEKPLVAALVDGLPLVSQPYLQVAGAIGIGEAQLIAALERMLADGRIRRIGTVIRHRRLGYRANAMVVWDVPDESIDAFGRSLAADRAVTLCYRRGRARPAWPYNLYCMVHGRERGTVLREVERLGRAHGLEDFARQILFSERCFAQRAARYG